MSKKKKKSSSVIMQEQDFFERNKEKGCANCTNKKNLTVDHIIPETILKNLNIDPAQIYDEENLQILCFACNMKKGQQLDFSIPKTKILLWKYLAELE